MRFRNASQCAGSKSGWVIAKCAPASTFDKETFDFVIQVFGGGIERHANREVGGPSQGLAGPIGSLVKPRGNFHQSNRIDFVDSARLRMIAQRRRIAGNRQKIAHAAHRPGAQQHGLQSDQVQVAAS